MRVLPFERSVDPYYALSHPKLEQFYERRNWPDFRRASRCREEWTAADIGSTKLRSHRFRRPLWSRKLRFLRDRLLLYLRIGERRPDGRVQLIDTG